MIIKNKNSNSWYHNPAIYSNTTWKYEDRIIPPNKQLYLRIQRLVEDDQDHTSVNSTAYVAITDETNWYPQTKSGAYAEKIISNIPANQWFTTSLQYRNDTNEPTQVRVWECVTGSTDGGYLKVESAFGGSF